jgi:ribosomal protein S18 acetylase RimI-like enzyme
MSISIRQAKKKDAALIEHILKTAFSGYHLLVEVEEPAKATRESAEDIILSMESNQVFVALYNHLKCVGTIRLRMLDENTGYISRFAVLPHWQQSGAGKLLLLAAEDWFRERGASFVMLQTAMSMTPLVNYYISAGFRLASVSDEKGYQRGKFVKPLV